MKHRKPTRSNETPEKKGGTVKFCLNCEDMDDLAFDSENSDPETVRKRYEDCVKRGNFDGDLCSRIYVIDDSIDAEFATGDDDED
jgi:hypothetical protein